MTIDRTKYLNLQEVRRLRQVTEEAAKIALENNHVGAVRRWMIVDLALSTGLRVSELALLTVEDFDFERKFVMVRRIKKRRRKKESAESFARRARKKDPLPIGSALIKHVQKYIKWEGLKEGPLLIGERGVLGTQGVRNHFKKACELAGVTLPFGTAIHAARHSKAVDLIGKGHSIKHVQKQLGHANITSSAVYADIPFDDMQKTAENQY